jgi:hypothetical protein
MGSYLSDYFARLNRRGFSFFSWKGRPEIHT